MQSRILPPEEWPRLVGTELESVWPSMPPSAQVVVVEERGAIVGCWALLPIYHVEGVWIAPQYRSRGSVARRLLHGMWTLARSVGAKAVVTGACSDQVRALIATLQGTKLPGDQYLLPVKGA